MKSTRRQETSKLLKGAYHLDTEVLRPVRGNPQRIARYARYPEMASMETTTTKMLADPNYWELVNGASECFIAGSTRDAIWQTI